MTAPTSKVQRLRGLDLAKKLIESQRESHEESLKAMKDSNSELSKAIENLKSNNTTLIKL
jgi:predicted  nucleic acid-binding Zn-ribbon protein